MAPKSSSAAPVGSLSRVAGLLLPVTKPMEAAQARKHIREIFGGLFTLEELEYTLGKDMLLEVIDEFTTPAKPMKAKL